MEGTTEPIIVVIGHPIAGNPSQFAVERALRWLELDWRVLSFDVKPEDVPAALEGFRVTGIAGVMIDPSVAQAALNWFDLQSADQSDPSLAETSLAETWVDDEDAESSPEQAADQIEASSPRPSIDCLSRDADSTFVATWQQRDWVDRRIGEHGGDHSLWLGDRPSDLPIDLRGFADDPAALPPEPEAVRAANLIVLAPIDDGEPALLECEEWPNDDGSTLVIDLTSGHPDSARLQEMGYAVITPLDLQIGSLQGCLQQWTGRECSSDVIYDAIEEYLGV